MAAAALPAFGGTSAKVRMTRRAVDALRKLRTEQTEQAASVARAIERIGGEPGVRFEAPNAGPDEQYMAMIPDDDTAPVVLYKAADEGYLVTGLLSRDAYNTYTRGSEPGFFDTPAGKALLIGGAGVLLAIMLSRSGKGASSP